MATPPPHPRSILSMKYLPILMMVFISACGGGDDAVGWSRITSFATDGPVISAGVALTDPDGTLCAAGTTDEKARFTLQIPADCKFPHHFTLIGGTDLITGEENSTVMHSLVVERKAGQSVRGSNISPLTTLIYYSSLAMADGEFKNITQKHVDDSRKQVMTTFGFGLDVDPLHARIIDGVTVTPESTDENGTIALEKITTSPDGVIPYIKANEGVMEVVRRSALTLGVEKNDLLITLGKDISDGELSDDVNFSDYKNTIERNTAIVSIEIIENRLQVTMSDGSLMDASTVTEKMGRAIVSVTSSKSTVTEEMGQAVLSVTSSKLSSREAEQAYKIPSVSVNFLEQTEYFLGKGTIGLPDLGNTNDIVDEFRKRIIAGYVGDYAGTWSTVDSPNDKGNWKININQLGTIFGQFLPDGLQVTGSISLRGLVTATSANGSVIDGKISSRGQISGGAWKNNTEGVSGGFVGSKVK